MTKSILDSASAYTGAPVWATVPEVARHCGIGASTVRRYVAQGILPAHKVGRSVRLDLREVDAFLKA